MAQGRCRGDQRDTHGEGPSATTVVSTIPCACAIVRELPLLSQAPLNLFVAYRRWRTEWQTTSTDLPVVKPQREQPQPPQRRVPTPWSPSHASQDPLPLRVSTAFPCGHFQPTLTLFTLPALPAESPWTDLRLCSKH